MYPKLQMSIVHTTVEIEAESKVGVKQVWVERKQLSRWGWQKINKYIQ